jgi:hypothetical protein
MPPTARPHRHEGKLWLAAAALAFLALALRLWDMFAERDGGENWLRPLFPLLFLVYTLGMYLRRKRIATEGHAPPTDGSV